MTIAVKVTFMDGEIWEHPKAIRIQRERGTIGVQTRRKDNSAGPAWTEFPLYNVRLVEVDQEVPNFSGFTKGRPNRD